MLCIFMQMFILFVSITIWTNVVYLHADVYTFCFINNMDECCVFSCRCLYFLFQSQYVWMLCIFMQMFILFVSLTIWSNVVYFPVDVYTFCFINNMVECCVFCFRCLYFLCHYQYGRMLCIFMQMFILFVPLTIWLNVLYFHADVYTYCVINNAVECCAFSCRCLYFLCH